MRQSVTTYFATAMLLQRSRSLSSEYVYSNNGVRRELPFSSADVNET